MFLRPWPQGCGRVWLKGNLAEPDRPRPDEATPLGPRSQKHGGPADISSSDALVKNLPDNNFKYLCEEFSIELLKSVKQKGVYPYEYMNSFEKFSEDKLPDRCECFSSLRDECISKKDYLKANNIWNVFKMNTIGDYHDLYLKTDVLLLAVFEKFINTCLDYYGLYSCHYFSSPGLSWM